MISVTVKRATDADWKVFISLDLILDKVNAGIIFTHHPFS